MTLQQIFWPLVAKHLAVSYKAKPIKQQKKCPTYPSKQQPQSNYIVHYTCVISGPTNHRHIPVCSNNCFCIYIFTKQCNGVCTKAGKNHRDVFGTTDNNV